MLSQCSMMMMRTRKHTASCTHRVDLWAALLSMWGPPVPLSEDGQALAGAREATARSEVHQLDLRLRNAMAGAVAQLRQCSEEDAVRAIQRLSEGRRALLGRARAQLGEGVAVCNAVEGAEVEFAEMCTAFLINDTHY